MSWCAHKDAFVMLLWEEGRGVYILVMRGWNTRVEPKIFSAPTSFTHVVVICVWIWMLEASHEVQIIEFCVPHIQMCSPFFPSRIDSVIKIQMHPYTYWHYYLQRMKVVLESGSGYCLTSSVFSPLCTLIHSLSPCRERHISTGVIKKGKSDLIWFLYSFMNW